MLTTPSAICGLTLLLLAPGTMAVTMAASMAGEAQLDQTIPQQVIVTGGQNEMNARRDSTAGKITIGRKRIEESGVEKVADLLAREPGLPSTLGALGSPTYTQFLIDGLPPAKNQNLADMDLQLVEKIEIIKTTVAEFGPYGIAGTINIITRKIIAEQKKTDVRVAYNTSAGQPGINLSSSLSHGKEEDVLSMNMQLSSSYKTMENNSSLNQTTSPSGSGIAQQLLGQASTSNRFMTLAASGNMIWRPDQPHQLIFSPVINTSTSVWANSNIRQWDDGSSLEMNEHFYGNTEQLSLPLSWTIRLDEQSQLMLSTRIYRVRGRMETIWNEYRSSLGNSLRRTSADNSSNSVTFKLDYKTVLADAHEIKTGMHLTRSSDSVDEKHWLNGNPDMALDEFNAPYSLVETKLRWFWQDDWRLGDSLSLNLGISGEQTTLDLQERHYQPHALYRVLSPSMHVLKKLNTEGTQRVRFSLARSFNAPRSGDLMQRPVINTLAPCLANGVCIANGIETADSSGNLDLQPERSQGLNVTYEYDLSANSLLSLGLYTRDIDKKRGSEIRLENVAWSNQARYVYRPVNFGDASVQGIDMELQLALRDLNVQAPDASLRAGFGLARSRVNIHSGLGMLTDNQTPWNAKLGASYTARIWPLKLDIDANWMPGNWVRINAQQRSFSPRQFSLNAGAVWKFSPDTSLTINLENILADSRTSVTEYSSGYGVVRQQSLNKSHTRLSMRLNFKL
ncbi:hypothetical protein UNDYM_5502 [Undibacterium sp. YM2]|uniref:TonB-dependent receptor plug domain-containing protein n=1 Tax=Undibacterium sp. YM2 TaxID=2058625 RepID=UPI001331C931|nr:TonB-dependent receptor [Undibacterium sp. YM2]BBB69755.1 hypothetical protein UNDYM_5502 [Undibacterium sp. YM2]